MREELCRGGEGRDEFLEGAYTQWQSYGGGFAFFALAFRLALSLATAVMNLWPQNITMYRTLRTRIC